MRLIFPHRLLVVNHLLFSFLPFQGANLLIFRVNPIFPRCQDRQNRLYSCRYKFKVQHRTSNLLESRSAIEVEC